MNKTRWQKRYNTSLFLLAGWSLFLVVGRTYAILVLFSDMPPGQELIVQVQILSLIAEFLTVVVCLSTLGVRFYTRTHAPRLTTVANILLLAKPVLGTVVGAIGLWKVRKDDRASLNPEASIDESRISTAQAMERESVGR